jgi:membrane protease YdiL (CAAX protease family)
LIQSPSQPGLTIRRRIILNVGLALAVIATIALFVWPKHWLLDALGTPEARSVLSRVLGGLIDFDDPRLHSSIRDLAHAINKTAMLVAWLVPLWFFPKSRDIGSFRFPRTWTLLLGLPGAVNNLFGYNILFYGFPTKLHMAVPWSLPVIIIWDALAVGIFEELIFRGYAFRHHPETHPRAAILISAACFALMHLVNLTHRPPALVLPSLLFTFTLGMSLGIVRMVSGSLAWCMLLHGLLDATSFLNFGIATHGVYFSKPTVIGGVASIATLCLHPKLRRPQPVHDETI